MKAIKIFIRVVLLVFVAGSVSYLVAKELIRESYNDATVKEPPAEVVAGPVNVRLKPDHIAAYYFYGNARCASCRKIEAYSKEGILKNFPDELKRGVLSFQAINVEEPENRHFIKDYGLYTKSLIVASYADDKQIRYKNLERVWDYLGSKEAFENYVKTELSGFLTEVKK